MAKQSIKKPKKGGRLKKAQSDVKRREGKRMYVKNGLALLEVATVLEVHIDTVRRWHKNDQWEKAKNMQVISIDGLKEEILNTFNEIKAGKTPKMSADQISKLVASFEKLSDKNKNLAYCIENYELLTDELIQKISEARGEKEKQYRMDIVKYVRAAQTKVIDTLYKDLLA